MRVAFRLTLFAAVVMCAASCGNQQTASTISSQLTQQDTTTTNVTVVERDTVLHYRFLDFRHDGSRERFLNESRKSDIFFLEDSSDVNIVRFLGADWLLNIKVDSLEKIKEITAITGNTSKEIFKKACTELRFFLGDPWLQDNEENTIRWHSISCEASLQHLRSIDGGWIMSFYNIIYPEFGDKHLNEKHKDPIRKFQEDVRSKDRGKIASHFKFPFDIGYPLPEITDKNDFLSRYELLFDKYIEEEISCSNDWSSWHGITCNSGQLLFGDVDSSNNFIVTSFSTHPEAYYTALEKEIEIQRQRIHPSLQNYQKPIVVARSESCLFRIDEVVPGELRLAIWMKGKTMKDRPDYVNKDGFISQVGSSGSPDWLFVNGTDTVWVGGYKSFDKEECYYLLKRYSGEKTLIDIKVTDFED